MRKWFLLLSLASLLALTGCNSGNDTDSGAVQPTVAPVSTDNGSGSADPGMSGIGGMDAPVGIGTYGYYEGRRGEDGIQFTWDNTCLNKPVDACENFVGRWQLAGQPGQRFDLYQTGPGKLIDLPAGQTSGDPAGTWSIRFDMEYIRGTWTSADGKTELPVDLQLAQNPRMQKAFELTGTWMNFGRTERARQRIFISNPTQDGFDYEILSINNNSKATISGTAAMTVPGQAVHRVCADPAACRFDPTDRKAADYEVVFDIPETGVIQITVSGNPPVSGDAGLRFDGLYSKTRLLKDFTQK